MILRKTNVTQLPQDAHVHTHTHTYTHSHPPSLSHTHTHIQVAQSVTRVPLVYGYPHMVLSLFLHPIPLSPPIFSQTHLIECRNALLRWVMSHACMSHSARVNSSRHMHVYESCYKACMSHGTREKKGSSDTWMGLLMLHICASCSYMYIYI